MTSGTDSEARASSLIAGRYRVEASLGRGGMGAVYLVHDERDGRKLALKQLRTDRSSNRALLFSQFEREYHTLSQLEHPRIIEVYDYGVEEDFAFYTMELLDGQDLRERGRQPWREVCAILCDVASSLAILHSRRLVHRDIAPGNVRYTRNGRAKLIDFGAMAVMGVVKHIVGTPPFVPPEALQRQALDGRADLYALGSLAYWMLTGRQAYPARSFEQLRDLWRSPPPTPRRLESSVPEALDRLVMELLSLDRAGRPDSAAEVIERLSGIAGLTLDESLEVSRAYLATPILVGRDVALQDVRQLLAQSKRGQGGSVLIEAEAGTGRSRFLDAAVLEAKLLGAVVLRADSGDAASAYGVARALGLDLLREEPEIAVRAARPWRALLASILPELEGTSHPPHEFPERRHLQWGLRNWFRRASRNKHLVIAVDDVHAIDEPSAALLAALADGIQGQKTSLLLTSTSEDGSSGAALTLLRQIARPLQLAPLTSEQTLALLRSMFGDVAHVNALAERVFQLAHGHPRWTMEVCERLVERRVARYEAGSWSLPQELSSEELPPSLGALLASWIANLQPDARELGEVLALTEPTAIAVTEYPALCAHRDRARTHRALDELVAAGILVPEGERYRFSQRELSDLFAATPSEQRRRELHARIASVATDCEDPLLLPRHLILGGREREGAECLVGLRDHPRVAYSSAALALLELAAEQSQQLGLPVELQTDIVAWLVSQAALLADYERFNRHAWPLLERLLRESGLADYLELEVEAPDPEARLALAFRHAESRWRAAPEALRGHPPAVACDRLASLCGTIATMATISMELWPIERLPSILPLVPAFPGAAVVQLHVEVSRAMISTRYDVAARHIAQLSQRIEHSDAGLNPSYMKQLRLGCRYMAALLTAAFAHPATRERLKELEAEPGHRVLAWRVHMIYELALGNTDAAADCQRRAELLNLQDGGQLVSPGTTAATELVVCAYAQDLLGVKRVLERIGALADRMPGWRPFWDVARAHYHRLQGDHAAARAALERALRDAAPGRTQAWTLAAPCDVMLLIAGGEPELAVERGLHYIDVCMRESLMATIPALQRVVAEALLKSGRVEDARRMIDEVLAGHRARSVKGLVLGMAYETRARVAIAMRDEAEVHSNAELCSQEYKSGRNLALSAKYQSLIREAEAVGLEITNASGRSLEPGAHGASHRLDHRTLSSRLSAYTDSQQRAQEAMRLLLELTGARGGYLFAVHDERLDPVGDLAQPPVGLIAWLERYLRHTLTAIDEVTNYQDDSTVVPGQPEQWTDETGRRYEPLPLFGTGREAARTPTVLAALHYEGDSRTVPQRGVLDMIADLLTDDERAADPEGTQLDALPGR